MICPLKKRAFKHKAVRDACFLDCFACGRGTSLYYCVILDEEGGGGARARRREIAVGEGGDGATCRRSRAGVWKAYWEGSTF